MQHVREEVAVLPQDFEDTVHARQLDGVVQKSGAKDESTVVEVRDAHLQYVSRI